VKPRFLIHLFNPLQADEEGKDLLVLRGNQLHVGILWITGVFSICYTLLNVYFEYYLDAAINISLLPGTLLYFFLFKKGKKDLSKILNLIHVCTVVGLHSLIHGPETFILSFFFPVIISTLIVFQGSVRRLGYMLTAAVFLWIMILVKLGVVFDEIPRFSEMQMMNEWQFNLGGAVLVTILEVAYIMYLSNNIQAELLEKQKLLNLRNKELSDSIAGRERLISIMSHDLRGPLTLIQSGLSVLEEPEITAAQRAEILVHLNKKTQASVQLLDNLLLWSRSETGQLRYSPENIGIRDVEKMIQHIFSLYQGEKDMHLEQHCLMFDRVYADRQMLNTIIRNLVSNAIKFTPSGGRVSVSAVGEGSEVAFSVVDSGKGMDEQILQMILNNHSVSKPGTEREKGHGLGLPLLKHFLKMHGKELLIRSKPGQGSVFSFKLPATAG
jgi:signal transduction histidine kinase